MSGIMNGGNIAGQTTGRDGGSQKAAVVGFGTAGVNAVIGLRNGGYTGEIHVFSDTDIPPYSPILTSYFVGGEKSYDECFPWSAEELDELGFELHSGSRVVSIDPEAHMITTEAGEELVYDKCVVCIGARPQTFGFPKVEGYEPLVLRTMDNAIRMKKAFERPECKRVLVSGASMIALKAVEAALELGLDVSLVGMNPHILDFSALPETAERFERGLTAKGVTMRFGQTISSVEPFDGGDGERHLRVTYSGGDVEDYDEIVVAHGVRSDLSLIREKTVEIDRAVVVDDFMRTSAPDLFAAGDVAQATELISGEKRVLGIWKTAALQGQCAGEAMAAELAGKQPDPARAYPGAFISNTIAVSGTLFLAAGISQAGEGRRVEIRESDEMTVATIYEQLGDGSERLVGFNVASDVDEPGGIAYDTAAMLTLRIEAACRS